MLNKLKDLAQQVADSIRNAPSDIAKWTNQEFGFAVTSVRQDVVEKPTYGRAVTPPHWHNRQRHQTDPAYQQARYQELYGHSPTEDKSPVITRSLPDVRNEPNPQQALYGIGIKGNSLSNWEATRHAVNDAYGLPQHNSPRLDTSSDTPIPYGISDDYIAQERSAPIAPADWRTIPSNITDHIDRSITGSPSEPSGFDGARGGDIEFEDLYGSDPESRVQSEDQQQNAFNFGGGQLYGNASVEDVYGHDPQGYDQDYQMRRYEDLYGKDINPPAEDDHTHQHELGLGMER